MEADELIKILKHTRICTITTIESYTYYIHIYNSNRLFNGGSTQSVTHTNIAITFLFRLLLKNIQIESTEARTGALCILYKNSL